ncbi:unnamed protein product (macronuclear) [Paramecium tetraurelia]|uniref:Transmembrane protein n=1 Tax=Paramecium tetraurelia TaxID=5888 RepID=A0BXM2_PARTE|nr:uncharacterized protein GSPATT00033142001 [Paramecium tetraurelia]CAK63289.1 unnamed protein product [Paramecium tetraurelia]|eukprot:XP_001430687.1 hypothetical protein (macronuclear) [Paramecium tetraurelia strain d4-2]
MVSFQWLIHPKATDKQANFQHYLLSDNSNSLFQINFIMCSNLQLKIYLFFSKISSFPILQLCIVLVGPQHKCFLLQQSLQKSNFIFLFVFIAYRFLLLCNSLIFINLFITNLQYVVCLKVRVLYFIRIFTFSNPPSFAINYNFLQNVENYLHYSINQNILYCFEVLTLLEKIEVVKVEDAQQCL